MKKLISLGIESKLYNEDFDRDSDKIKAFLNLHGIDGLEVILYGEYMDDNINHDLIYGNHLLYWPYLIDFYRYNETELLNSFFEKDNINNYYMVNSPDELIKRYKDDFEIAKKFDVDYMVFHVTNVEFSEMFSCVYKYDDKHVLRMYTEIINKIFTGNGPMLLFENLWLPGLNYISYKDTKDFFDSIEYKNKGFVLDINHLLLTNHDLKDVDDEIQYIHKCLDNLGELIHHIKVIHLNKTNTNGYLSKNYNKELELYYQKDNLYDRFMQISTHIKNIDAHNVYMSTRINEIIERVAPDYLVYEFFAKDINDLSTFVTSQNFYLGDR